MIAFQSPRFIIMMSVHAARDELAEIKQVWAKDRLSVGATGMPML